MKWEANIIFEDDPNGTIKIIDAKSGNLIATMSDDESVNRRNSEFLITAVNSHIVLKHALEQVRKQAERHSELKDCEYFEPEMMEVMLGNIVTMSQTAIEFSENQFKQGGLI